MTNRFIHQKLPHFAISQQCRPIHRSFFFIGRYRKQTKSQFARDDPAFLVLLAGWLVVSSAGFALVLGVSLWAYVKLLLYVVLVDCVGVGMVVATALWALCNKYLLKPAFR